MSSRDQHEPADGGAQRHTGVRGMGAGVIALLIAIAALIVLALATRTDSPAGRRSSGVTPAARSATAVPAAARARIEANRRQRGALLDGSLASKLAELDGVPVVVNQWASWCPPCRAEFPFFAAMAERYRDQIAFLGLDSRDERGAAKAFVDRHPVGYPSIVDEDARQARSIGAGTRWPTTIFFDANGKAAFIRQGGYPDAAALEADIRAYALGLPPARQG